MESEPTSTVTSPSTDQTNSTNELPKQNKDAESAENVVKPKEVHSKETVANKVVENAPIVTTFTIENKVLRDKITPSLREVSFENVVNTVNAIKDPEVKKNIQEYIKDGLIVMMQEYVGMYRDSKYPDNKANGYLDGQTIKRLGNSMLLQKGEKLIPSLAGDVQGIYKNFLSGKINNGGMNYSIISKDDFTIYIFNSEHRLIGKYNVLLGKQKGDYPPILKKGGSKFTTPGGFYTIDALGKDKGDYAGPGDYYQLKPRDRRYPVADFSIGIHTYFYVQGDRLGLLESMSKVGKNVTNGCVNTPVAGTIYDNLFVGSVVYIAFE